MDEAQVASISQRAEELDVTVCLCALLHNCSFPVVHVFLLPSVPLGSLLVFNIYMISDTGHAAGASTPLAPPGGRHLTAH